MSAPMFPRSAIVCLLGAALTLSACDTASPANGQAEVASTDEVSSDEVGSAGTGAAPQAGKVDRTHKGETAPAASFTGPDGKATTLASFAGKPVLMNLWATWCAPCVKEMPTLEALAARGGVRVVTISQDMEPAKAVAFLKERRLTHLTPYLDPKLGLSTGLGASLPTTILYDARGREVWRVTGDLDWAGAEAKTLLGEVS